MLFPQAALLQLGLTASFFLTALLPTVTQAQEENEKLFLTGFLADLLCTRLEIAPDATNMIIDPESGTPYLYRSNLETLSSFDWTARHLKPAGNSDKFESELSLARLSERHGQADQAQKIYQAVLRTDPKNQLAHHSAKP